jgi:hypothetical protein
MKSISERKNKFFTGASNLTILQLSGTVVLLGQPAGQQRLVLPTLQLPQMLTISLPFVPPFFGDCSIYIQHLQKTLF